MELTLTLRGEELNALIGAAVAGVYGMPGNWRVRVDGLGEGPQDGVMISMTPNDDQAQRWGERAARDGGLAPMPIAMLEMLARAERSEPGSSDG